MSSFCLRLSIVTCLAGLSLCPRLANAAPIASGQKATPVWASPWILGSVGATGFVGAVAVLMFKRSTEADSSRSMSGEFSSLTTDRTPANDLHKTTVSQAIEQSSVSAARAASDSPQSTEAVTQVETPMRLAKINIVDELTQELRSTDPARRRKAIWELGQRGDTRAVQSLVDLLIDSDSKQRSLILSALSEIGTRTLKPMTRALAISLQDENPEVRKNAIRDLTRVYDMVSQISNLLHMATDDPDAEVQETARWALGQLARIRSVPDQNLASLKGSIAPPENLSV